jgi:hypothetical protein
LVGSLESNLQRDILTPLCLDLLVLTIHNKAFWVALMIDKDFKSKMLDLLSHPDDAIVLKVLQVFKNKAQALLENRFTYTDKKPDGSNDNMFMMYQSTFPQLAKCCTNRSPPIKQLYYSLMKDMCRARGEFNPNLEVIRGTGQAFVVRIIKETFDPEPSPEDTKVYENELYGLWCQFIPEYNSKVEIYNDSHQLNEKGTWDGPRGKYRRLLEHTSHEYFCKAADPGLGFRVLELFVDDVGNVIKQWIVQPSVNRGHKIVPFDNNQTIFQMIVKQLRDNVTLADASIMYGYRIIIQCAKDVANLRLMFTENDGALVKLLVQGVSSNSSDFDRSTARCSSWIVLRLLSDGSHDNSRDLSRHPSIVDSAVSCLMKDAKSFKARVHAVLFLKSLTGPPHFHFGDIVKRRNVIISGGEGFTKDREEIINRLFVREGLVRALLVVAKRDCPRARCGALKVLSAFCTESRCWMDLLSGDESGSNHKACVRVLNPHGESLDEVKPTSYWFPGIIDAACYVISDDLNRTKGHYAVHATSFAREEALRMLKFICGMALADAEDVETNGPAKSRGMILRWSLGWSLDERFLYAACLGGVFSADHARDIAGNLLESLVDNEFLTPKLLEQDTFSKRILLSCLHFCGKFDMSLDSSNVNRFNSNGPQNRGESEPNFMKIGMVVRGYIELASHVDNVPRIQAWVVRSMGSIWEKLDLVKVSKAVKGFDDIVASCVAAACDIMVHCEVASEPNHVSKAPTKAPEKAKPETYVAMEAANILVTFASCNTNSITSRFAKLPKEVFSALLEPAMLVTREGSHTREHIVANIASLECGIALACLQLNDHEYDGEQTMLKKISPPYSFDLCVKYLEALLGEIAKVTVSKKADTEYKVECGKHKLRLERLSEVLKDQLGMVAKATSEDLLRELEEEEAAKELDRSKKTKKNSKKKANKKDKARAEKEREKQEAEKARVEMEEIRARMKVDFPPPALDAEVATAAAAAAENVPKLSEEELRSEMEKIEAEMASLNAREGSSVVYEVAVGDVDEDEDDDLLAMIQREEKERLEAAKLATKEAKLTAKEAKLAAVEELRIEEEKQQILREEARIAAEEDAKINENEEILAAVREFEEKERQERKEKMRLEQEKRMLEKLESERLLLQEAEEEARVRAEEESILDVGGVLKEAETQAVQESVLMAAAAAGAEWTPGGKNLQLSWQEEKPAAAADDDDEEQEKEEAAAEEWQRGFSSSLAAEDTAALAEKGSTAEEERRGPLWQRQNPIIPSTSSSLFEIAAEEGEKEKDSERDDGEDYASSKEDCGGWWEKDSEKDDDEDYATSEDRGGWGLNPENIKWDFDPDIKLVDLKVMEEVDISRIEKEQTEIRNILDSLYYIAPRTPERSKKKIMQDCEVPKKMIKDENNAAEEQQAQLKTQDEGETLEHRVVREAVAANRAAHKTPEARAAMEAAVAADAAKMIAVMEKTLMLKHGAAASDVVRIMGDEIAKVFVVKVMGEEMIRDEIRKGKEQGVSRKEKLLELFPKSENEKE